MHQHTREEKSIKPTKMCSLENGLWLLRYAGRPTPKKIIKKWTRKTASNKKINPTNQKGNAGRDAYASGADGVWFRFMFQMKTKVSHGSRAFDSIFSIRIFRSVLLLLLWK